VVGGEGEGFRFAMMGLDGGRLNIGACSLGRRAALPRRGDPIHQGPPAVRQADRRFPEHPVHLADMATELEAARALLYLAAAKVTAGAPDKTKFAAMAKRFATDTGSPLSTARSSSSAAMAI
jgi:alkylation response protein AidB-like acyl-CoA dehydrogenase